MKEMRHSKIKNTGILFELLTRQVTSDIMKDGTQSKAIELIRRNFGPKTALYKEYMLYQTLVNQQFTNENKASELLTLVLERRSKISESKLRKEKYNLIKEIKESYDIDLFFNNKINNYKVYASIYKLFEADKFNNINPVDIVESKHCIVEHIIGKNKKALPDKDDLMEEYSKQTKDIRLLAYKIMLEQFNSKFSGLGVRERKLLREYINNVGTPESFLKYINDEVKYITESLQKCLKKVTDETVKIKINETLHILNDIPNKKRITETNIYSMLNFYKLLTELKNIK